MCLNNQKNKFNNKYFVLLNNKIIFKMTIIFYNSNKNLLKIHRLNNNNSKSQSLYNSNNKI